MSNKSLKSSIKRVNKSKNEIVSDIVRIQKREHMKEIISKVYPLLQTLDTIYDGQTVVNALSGFIMAHVENESARFKLNQLPIDLKGEENTQIKKVLLDLIEMFKDEPAKELSAILERLGKTFGDYGAAKFLKNPIKDLPLTDILA